MSICDDVTRQIVEKVALTGPLREHARACPACAAMVQVSAPPPARVAEGVIPDALRAALDADSRALTPYAPWRTAAAPSALAAVLVAVALVRLPRRDLAGQLGPAFAAATLALVSLASAGVAFVVHRGARGLGPTVAQRATFAAASLPLFVAVVIATTRAAPGSLTPNEDDAIHGFAHCAGFGTVVSALTLAVLLAAARRSSPVAPALTGGVAGLASGFVGALFLHLACPVATLSHGVFAHGAPAVVAGVLGTLIGRRVLSP